MPSRTGAPLSLRGHLTGQRRTREEDNTEQEEGCYTEIQQTKQENRVALASSKTNLQTVIGWQLKVIDPITVQWIKARIAYEALNAEAAVHSLNGHHARG